MFYACVSLSARLCICQVMDDPTVAPNVTKHGQQDANSLDLPSDCIALYIGGHFTAKIEVMSTCVDGKFGDDRSSDGRVRQTHKHSTQMYAHAHTHSSLCFCHFSTQQSGSSPLVCSKIRLTTRSLIVCCKIFLAATILEMIMQL